VIDLIVGLFGGFLLSALFWWLLAHGLVPRLGFATAISKLDDREPGKVVYRIKMENVGRRKIIDLSFRARVYVPGFHVLPGARTTTTIVEVPLDMQHLFILRPRNNRIIWLEVSGVADEYAGYLDEELVRSLAERRDGSLEALLRLSDDAYLVV
jgi:hypothetical protein